MRFLPALAPLIFLSLMALSCGDKGVPPQPVPTISLQIVSGNNQMPKAGAFLVDSFLVRVMTNKGQPVPDVEVVYEQITPIDGGYFVWNTVRITDDSGYAKNKYYADELIGIDSIRVTASGVDDSVIYFVLDVVPDDPDTIFRVDGNNQTGPGGQKLANPCTVKITDKFGNPIFNHRVKFKSFYRCLVEADSSVHLPRLTDSVFTRTNADGEAQVEWWMTVNPMPYIPYWPNSLPTMKVFNELGDSVMFYATADSPGTFEYYYDTRDIFEEHCFKCHTEPTAPGTDYTLDYFYRLADDGNLDPPDSAAPLLEYLMPENHIYVDSINWIEQDIVINWVVAHDTAHGASGLNNYDDNMRAIFDTNCATVQCHRVGAPEGSVYILSSHSGLRGGGNDATPNAIPGDSASLLVQVLLTGGSMRSHLGVDSVALADSIVNWVVDDRLRQY